MENKKKSINYKEDSLYKQFSYMEVKKNDTEIE